MRSEFIETGNTRKFFDICHELGDSSSLVGPSLAMVTGPAGRGKTEAARQYAAQTDAIYIPPLNVRTPTMLLREIAFELAGLRPGRSEQCLAIIGEAMQRDRRLIMIDEADLLEMRLLEMLRNVNERFAAPILLIGEDDLKGRVASRRRLASRIRRRLEFGPVSQVDIAYFFRQNLALTLSADMSAPIHAHCRGDWRPVLTVAVACERAARASNLKELTTELVKDVIKNA